MNKRFNPRESRKTYAYNTRYRLEQTTQGTAHFVQEETRALCPEPIEPNLRIHNEGISDEDKNEIRQTYALTLQPGINGKVQTTS
jgi:hypothetical protein